jgi:hypothetical protein
VLESEKRQKKKDLAVQPRLCSVWVHRTVSSAPGWRWSNWPLSGFCWWRTAKNHRTVRWCTRLSGEPTVSQVNGRPRNPRVTRGRANGLMGAPDSVRCANGSKSSMVGCARIGKQSAPDSVRWCTGLSDAPVDRRQELPSWIALNGS